MMTLELGGEQRQHQYELLEQRRETLRSEIGAIYRRYDEHIGSRLRASAGSTGFLDLDALPSDEELCRVRFGEYAAECLGGAIV